MDAFLTLEKTVMVFRGSIFFKLNNRISERFTYGTLAAGVNPCPCTFFLASDTVPKSYTLSLSGGYDVPWPCQYFAKLFLTDKQKSVLFVHTGFDSVKKEFY
jgi:hypothetical protein